MINGISDKKTNYANVPLSEIKNRDSQNTEKIKKEEEKVASSDDIKKQDVDTQEAMDKIVSSAKIFNKEIQLELERDLGIMVVKVIDGKTNEVIRQIPSEEMVELSKNARDLKGLLIDKEG